MSHYKSNLRDIAFNLFEASCIQDHLGTAPFDALDEATAREVLAEVDRLARGPLAASFVDADRNPPVLRPGGSDVTLPASLTDSITALYDGDWHRLNLPTHLGGFGAPPSLQWACAELILGANPAVFLYALTGSSFAAVLDAIGTDDQKRLAAAAIERLWGATMVLTEPDAGSDVGAGRTKATEQPDGSWHIEGVKRFITSGDWDLPANILHWVLARPVGAGAGTKGLSLFIVPKFLFDWNTFGLGDRNGVHVTNLEHKMGLKASSTCELTFGDTDPAVGYLVGDKHNGIAQMFLIIEQARMMVGTKSIATLSTGYLNALEYATTRMQGSDLASPGGSAAPRVAIVRHPDVRRALMTQKAYSEGMRALYLYACTWQDKIRLAEARGERDDAAVRINDLLLPIVKGFGSERSYALLSSESLQTFGGSGYLEDYPVEQYIRDSKIDTLYEGTTAIQGQDLFFRKIVRDRGQSMAALSQEIRAFVASEAGNGRLKDERALLATALADTQAMIGTLVGWTTSARANPGAIYKVGQNSSRLLMALGDLLTGWLLLRHAEIALDALSRAGTDKERAFYEGKVASARFFAAQVLPRLTMDRAVLEATDDSLMQIPDECF